MTITRNELNIIISARDEKMRKVFERAEKRATRFEATTRRTASRTTRHFSAMGNSARRAGPAISAAFPASAPILASAGAVTAFGLALSSVVKNGDKLKQLRGRLEAITGSAVLAESGVEGLTSIMVETGTTIDSVSSAFTRFTLAGEQIGATQSEVLELTDTLAKFGQIGGSSTQEIKAAMTQLGQGLASGILRGEEFNSLMENFPVAAKALADSLGVGTGELRKMAEQGELTSRKVFDALLSKADEADKKFAELPMTVERASGRMAAAWARFTDQIDDSIGLSSTLARILDGIAGRFARASATGLELVQAQISERQDLLNQRGPGSLPVMERERVQQQINDLKAVEAQYLKSAAAMEAADKARAEPVKEEPVAGGSSRSGSAQAPLADRLDAAYNEEIDALIEREELIGKTAEQQARLNAENTLRNRLEAEAGDAIDRAGVLQKIEELSMAYGDLAAATYKAEEAERKRLQSSADAAEASKRAREEADTFIENTVDGLVNAGLQADNFTDALKAVGKQLATLAASDVLKGLLGLGGSSAGSIFGDLGSLLGSSSLGSLSLGFKDGVVGVGSNGLVRGPGGPRGDKIPAMLSAGETVMTARATQRNAPMLRAMNEGKSFGGGGGTFAPSTSIHVAGDANEQTLAQMQRIVEAENAKFYDRWKLAQKNFNERAA